MLPAASLAAFRDELSSIYGIEKDAGPIGDFARAIPGAVKKGVKVVDQASLKAGVKMQNHPLGKHVMKHLTSMDPSTMKPPSLPFLHGF
jgi:hypothetical protein